MSVDFKTGINGKINSFYKYLGDRSSLDRTVGVIQFTAMTFIEPAKAAGQPQLSHNLRAIMDLCGYYRRLTRFTQWGVIIPILSPAGVKAYIKEYNPTIAAFRVLCTGLFSVYLLGEELNLFATMGMIEAHWGQKINRFRIVCLFWSNLCRLIMSYLVLKEMKYDEKQGEKDPVLAKTHKKRVLAVWDGILMTLFAYTLQKGARPAGPGHLPKALESGSVIELLTCLVPPIYTVPTTPQGILGVASLVPSILMGLV